MEILILILGMMIVLFFLYMLLHDFEDLSLSPSELDDLVEEQMREQGLSEEEIDDIQRGPKMYNTNSNISAITMKYADRLTGTRWQRKEQNEEYPYNGYTVLMVTNLLHEHPAHPPQVVYQGDNKKVWSLNLSRWPGNLEPETQENFNKVPSEKCDCEYTGPYYFKHSVKFCSLCSKESRI